MDRWRQAIELGARLGLFSTDMAGMAHERLRQARPEEVSAEVVGSWVGRSPVEVNDLLGLVPLVPADTPTQRLHETVLARGGGDTALARALLEGRSTPPTAPLPQPDLPTAKLGTPEAQTPTVKPASASPRPNIPRRLGPYVLGDELGHGGMGIVFRARHEKLGSACAVKVMIAGEHASPEEIERFKVEARSVAKMGKHPNIVTVYDLDSQGSLTYYAMELVEGTSLAKVLRQREEPFTPQETARLMEKVARAVHFAHQHGIIHRDLKPDNVVVRADGEPQVMDFGLARDVASTERMSVRGQVMGSPNYMSPEQARGDVEATDARTDVYGLGAILYEMLTGFPPHPGKALHQVLVHILRGDIVPTRRIRPSTPKDLDTVCLKCLELEASRRYSSARELASELTRFQRGEPVRARPVSPPEALWRMMKRRRGVAIPTVVAASLAIGFATWVVIGAHRQQGVADSATNQERLRHFQELLEEGREAYQRRDFREAQSKLEDACRAFPDDHDAKARLDETMMAIDGRVRDLVGEARVLLEHGRGAAAGIKLQEALQLRPKDREIQALLDQATQTSVAFAITSDPSGAKATVVDAAGEVIPEEDKNLGPSPVSHRLPPGSYVVSLELEGRATVRLPIWLVAGAPDPRLSVKMFARDKVPEEMVVVPGGEFVIGGSAPQALPAGQLNLPTFLMDRHELTCAEYAKFLATCDRKPPDGWEGRQPPKGEELLPVRNVTWFDAEAYAKWAGKRLPTEEEWEKAARGVDGRPYPWGRQWKEGLSHCEDLKGGPAAVELTKTDLSPYGCFDMAGNVCEWTASPWQGCAAPIGSMVVRGNSWAHYRVVEGKHWEDCTRRAFFERERADVFLGFRCARDP